jgi:hypothetical protein
MMVQACRLSFMASAILFTAIWLGGPQLIAGLFGSAVRFQIIRATGGILISEGSGPDGFDYAACR